MLKKIICLATAMAVTTGLLAGCSTSGSSSSQASGISSDALQTSAADTKKDVITEEFKISIASTSLGDAEDSDPANPVAKNTREYLEKTLKVKYPNVTVEWFNLPGDQYENLFKAKNASGTLEDVFAPNIQNPKSYMKAGVMADLSDSPWVKDVVESAKENCTYSGKWYGAPQQATVVGIFYNKKIFADVGASVPKTWAELLDVCGKIKSKGIDPFVGGFKDNWVLGMTWGTFVTAFMQSETENPSLELYNGKIKLDGPEYMKTINRLEELFKKNYFNKDCLSIGWDQSRPHFASGKAAMLIQGSWLPGMVNTLNKDLDMGFFPVPNDDGTAPLSVAPGPEWSVNAKTTHLEAAKEVVNIFSSRDGIVVRLKNQGLSAYKGYNVEYGIPVMTEISNILGSVKVVGNSGNYLASSANNKVCQEVLTKIAAGKTIESDMTDAQNLQEKDKSTIVPPEN